VVTIAIPQIEKANVRAVSILSAKRSPILPELATAAEQGVSGFAASTWFAVFAPKGTPAQIVMRLHAALMAGLETPAVQARFKEIGAETVAPERRSPDYLRSFLGNEIAKWTAAIKAANLKVD
jgi:tripartite-type tricarboxylate transporter receptor subunit TctC